MIKMELFFGVVSFALMVYCLIECIGTPEGSVRNLPKVAWVFIILLFPLVGSIAWLAVGRPDTGPPLTRTQGAAPNFPEYHRPGRMAPADEAKDEEFLRSVRERAERQRKAYEAEKKRKAQEEEE
jgi:hypothetical protein